MAYEKRTLTAYKFLLIFVLALVAFTPLGNVAFVLSTPTARAFDFSGEGDKMELDCGVNGIGPGLFGSCVPIQVAADPNRGTRNVLKNIFTATLYGAGIAMGKWIGSQLNKKLQITDYYGYNRSLSDVVFRYRILFDKYLDPTDRKLVDMGYDEVFRGGMNYSRVYVDLSTITTQQPAVKNLPKVNATPLGSSNSAAFQDPGIYPQLALLGAQETPETLYFKYQGAAIATKNQAQSSAASEIANSEGYKSSRNKDDLAALAQLSTNPALRTSDFYKTGKVTYPGSGGATVNFTLGDTSGQIRSPGGYVAKVVQVSVQRLLNRDYLTNNVLYAAITEGSAWAFFRLFSGGIFGSNTAALGQTPNSGNLGETTYKNANALTDTNAESGNATQVCQCDDPNTVAVEECPAVPACNAGQDNSGVYQTYSGPNPGPCGQCLPSSSGSGGGAGALSLSADINAVPLTVTNSGDGVILSWSCQNATSASVTPGGYNQTSGYATIQVYGNDTYTLTCIGSGGQTATDSVTITVQNQ
ncbi:MAG: hypothetical protein M1275_03425 [Patescibacteria group bacterium]|nr:hypothetical protein [Patescibacteria group bacterium]